MMTEQTFLQFLRNVDGGRLEKDTAPTLLDPIDIARILGALTNSTSAASTVAR